MNRITVVMSVYNDSKTLKRALDSILQQSYTAWELILCDDGSTDNTLEIMNVYKERFPNKITVLRNSNNKGLPYSLNLCIEKVNTEYIARMDADDYCLPDRFEKQISFLDSHPEYAFVGSSINRFDENGIWKTSIAVEEPRKEHFLYSTSFVHPSTMIRTEAIKSIGGYRDLWYTKRCEDYDLWMRLYHNDYIGFNLKEPLLNYYEGRNSFSKRKYRYRLCEAVTRAIGYYRLNLLPVGLLFVIKPLIVGLLPSYVIKLIHYLKR